MIVKAVSASGVHVTFDTRNVTDWSWNAVAENSPNDPPLEVVFSRGETESLTEKMFFWGNNAARVSYALCETHCAGSNASDGEYYQFGVHQ